MPSVSIIVPVYNAGKTIERCINSVLNQTCTDFELILLDDGSTDDSGQICDAFAGKDARIRVQHKENTGVSDTRNQGIGMKKTIQMKRTVFAYYNSFYKDVLGDTGYEKRKGQIYRFLFDAAGDGGVSSFKTPGNYRLGDERGNISESVLEGEGILFDLYRERKLWEKLFDIVAVRNGLTAADVKLLYCLSQSYKGCTEKEIAEILGISGRALSAAIKRLLAQEMIVLPEKAQQKAGRGSRAEVRQQGDKKKTAMKEYAITPESEAVLSEVLFLEQILYDGFRKKEMETYEKLEGKRKEKIKEILRM